MARSLTVSEGGDDWPIPSSPTLPPKVTVYFARRIGATRQPPNVKVFMSDWQAGIWVRTMFADSEFLGLEEDGTFEYRREHGMSEDGEPLFRTFWGRIAGATYEEMMKASEGRSTDVMPWGERLWVRVLRGDKEEYHANGASDMPQAAPEPRQPAPAGQAPAVAVSRGVKRQPTPRASRDGLLSVATLADQAGVDGAKVRSALRSEMEKPPQGWAFEEGSKEIALVRKLIAKLGGGK